MSIKKKMMDEINKRAQKTRDLRADKGNKKNVEAYAFDFFAQAEEHTLMGSHEKQWLIMMAFNIFYDKVREIDRNASADIIWIEGTDSVQGVKVKWSSLHQTTHQVDPEFCIDVSQMLFV